MLKNFFEFIGSVAHDVAIFILQISLGVGAKIAFESKKRSITIKYVLSSFIIACFVGYVTDRFCTKQGWENVRGIAVPVMALISESFVKYLYENGPGFIGSWFKKHVGVDEKPNKNERKS